MRESSLEDGIKAPPLLDTSWRRSYPFGRVYRSHRDRPHAHTVGAARFLLLNRPERRNALVPDLARKLAAEVRAAEQDKGIRAVALRGAGGHFSVGLDLKWYLTLGDTPPRSVLEEGLRAFQDTIRAVVRSPLPIIALLEGSVAKRSAPSSAHHFPSSRCWRGASPDSASTSHWPAISASPPTPPP
jgi:hypothetical protein